MATRVGIGMADVTTDRLVRHIDWEPTRVNALQFAGAVAHSGSVHFASDRECLNWVAATAGKLEPADVTYGWIRNTLALDSVGGSHNLREPIERQPHLEIEREIEVSRLMQETWWIRLSG